MWRSRGHRKLWNKNQQVFTSPLPCLLEQSGSFENAPFGSICPVLKNLHCHPISFRGKIKQTHSRLSMPLHKTALSPPQLGHLGSPAFHAVDNQALCAPDSSRASSSSSDCLLVLLIPAQTSHPQRRLLSPLSDQVTSACHRHFTASFLLLVLHLCDYVSWKT